MTFYGLRPLCGYSDRLRNHETALWHTTSFLGKVPPLPVFVKAHALNDGYQLCHKVTLPVVENFRLTLHKKPCFCNFHPTSKIWLLPDANILIELVNFQNVFGTHVRPYLVFWDTGYLGKNFKAYMRELMGCRIFRTDIPGYIVSCN